MADPEELIIYKCKYWNEFEPPECLHWDSVGHICTFEDSEGDSSPTYYPYCNYIGTASNCSEYNSTGEVIPMCVLPDPSRHTCNRATGDKWVPYPTASKDEDGELVLATLDFSTITGYNGGLCDGAGKDVTCKGYNPAHMSFGMLAPGDEDDNDIDMLNGGKYSTIAEIGTRTPIDYVIRNLMAKLGCCYWWNGPAGVFVVKQEETTDFVTGEVIISYSVLLEGSWLCTCDGKDEYKTFADDGSPPCNGCKQTCPNYTGICWEYCIDDKMRSGDPILCEHVHELRYYVRQNAWTVESLNKYFYDEGFIYAWKGDLSDKGPMGNITYQFDALTGGIESYEIGAIKTYMDSFLFLDIKSELLLLTEGTEVDSKASSFPTLVSDLNDMPLAPVIMNRFIEVDGLKYFEITGLFKNNLLIFGKTFYSAKNYSVYILNLSDKYIRGVIPKEVLEQDFMVDIELTLGKTKFSEFYNSFKNILNAIINTGSGKAFFSTLNSEATFACNVEMVTSENSYYGTDQNDLIVIQNTPDGIEYSKMSFNKAFVGGALVQTNFTLEGSGKTHSPYDFTQGFYANINHNGSITFEFCPIAGSCYSSRCDRFYNDMEMADMATANAEPPDLPTLYRGFKLYKIYIDNYILENGSKDGSEISDVSISDCEFTQLSPDGYVLINLNSKHINSVFGPWEVDSIIVYNSLGNCEMEIVYHGSDGLIGPNQLIVKPKDMTKFVAVCNDTSIVLKNICYYDKRSHDQSPVIDDGWISEEVVSENYNISYVKDRSSLTVGGGAGLLSSFTLVDFQFMMVPSVVIVGIEGRPMTQYRTKPLGWVKQPYCPDVEINYSWSASYNKFQNVPSCYCCGSHKGYSAEGSNSHYLLPPCGDHDISSITNVGPMWWPYDNCAEIYNYNIINSLGYGSMDIVGLFKMDGLHGSHDMRMLGPENSFAYTGYGCNFLKRCTCDWRTYIETKVGDNVFTGWARYRGGNSGDIGAWLANGEALPKFGNVDRVEMLTYRTMDKRQYEYSSDGGETWSIGWELMPAFMAFTDVDFTKEGGNFWDYGASAVGPDVVNPLGMYKATNLDGCSINEFVNDEERFRFEDVFESRTLLGDWISYPRSAIRRTKDGKAVTQWYEFKTASSGDYIQWAWRGPWTPVERNITYFNSLFYSALVLDEISRIKGPFFKIGGVLKGRFSFLTIEYPDYMYDWTGMELIKVIDEGVHLIKFTAPEKDEYTGEYAGGFELQLDDGPVRCFDLLEGTWQCESSVEQSEDQAEACNTALYMECTNNPDFVSEEEEEDSDSDYAKNDFWSSDVTLFGTGYENADKATAEADGRCCVTYTTPTDEGDLEIENKEYFQRGLNVSIDSSAVVPASLPISTVYLYEHLFVADPFVCGTVNTFTNLYLTGQQHSVGRAVVTFQYGSELYVPEPYEEGEESEEGEDVPDSYKYFHAPQIIIFSWDYEDGIEEIGRSEEVELYDGVDGVLEEKTLVVNWTNSIDYLFAGKKGVIIEVCNTPSQSKIDSLNKVNKERYEKSATDGVNLISLINCELYEDKIVSAVEEIKTWERKFYISTGGSGDAAPHKDRALGVIPNYRSTVYQKDRVFKIAGSEADEFNMISKTRSRLLRKTYTNETPVSGELELMEKEQERLYNEALGTLPDIVTMTPIVPPGLYKVLQDYNLTFYSKASFTMTNTVTLPIASINSFEPMSGEGYTWLDSNYAQSRCDGGGDCGFGVMSTTFTYQYFPLDANADLHLLLSTAGNALGAYESSATVLLETRLYTYQLLMSNGYFNKYTSKNEYGKIWVDVDSGLIFPTITPRGEDTASSSVLGTVFDAIKSWFWSFIDNMRSMLGIG